MFTIDFPGVSANVDPPLASEQPYFENLNVARDVLQQLTPKAQGLRMKASQTHRSNASDAEKIASLDALRRKQHTAQTELALWSKAFQRWRASHSTQQATSFAVHLLFAKYISTKVHVETASAISQDIYLQHVEDFRSVVAAAEEGMRHTSDDQKSIGFTFEGGFLVSLYLTGLKCRQPAIRRRLLQLMQQTNAKEGLWCRNEAICVVTRVMDLEEGRSSIPSQDNLRYDPNLPNPPLFYEVSCEANYRKSGSLFVDVTYILYDEGLPAPWRTLKETLLIEG